MTPTQVCEQALDQAIAQEEAIIERHTRILYWLDRYDPIDWSPFLIIAVVFWAVWG